MRYETVWSGVQVIDEGRRLEVASEPGLCGCVTFVNRSNTQIQLRAKFRDALRGVATLAPRQRLTVRFDWAGDTSEHAYVIDAVDAEGRAVVVTEAIDIGENSGSRPCSSAGCEWGALNMRAATVGQ